MCHMMRISGLTHMVLWFLVCFTLSCTAESIDELSVEKTDPRVFFSNYTSGLLGLFPVDQMTLSTMNVLVVLGIGALVAAKYISSDSPALEEVSSYSSTFREFMDSEQPEGGFQLMSFITSAIELYNKLNEKEAEE